MMQNHTLETLERAVRRALADPRHVLLDADALAEVEREEGDRRLAAARISDAHSARTAETLAAAEERGRERNRRRHAAERILLSSNDPDEIAQAHAELLRLREGKL